MSPLKRACVSLLAFFALAVCSVFAQDISNDTDFVTSNTLPNSRIHFKTVTPQGHKNGMAFARFGTAPSVDSLATFNGQFFAAGFDNDGNPQNHWYTSTVGNPPAMGGTTTIKAPVVPVSVDLLQTADPTSAVRFHIDGNQFLQPVLSSPIFQNTTYSSSNVPTQYEDAVQRAEYINRGKADWHTMLAASAKTSRTIRVPRGKYLAFGNADGTCCLGLIIDFNTFVNLFFPAVASDTTTPIGAAENAGEVTTKDISSFIFPNTLLADFHSDGRITGCCVGGFHTYDFEPANATDKNKIAEKRYVVNYSAWITSAYANFLFGDGNFADILPLSHEISETLNDPFVVSDNIHNLTPWYLSPTGFCANVLETGDALEGSDQAAFPMTMNGFTYHPQNIPLLQWFEFKTPSDAVNGAYSYPNETLLTHVSSLQNPGCQP
jgi:hypothetical protein